MAKEIIRLFRIDDPSGSITIEMELNGNRYFMQNFANEEALRNLSLEWANNHLIEAGRLALCGYVAVDPTVSDPSLLTDVVTEIDPAALSIVRRVVPV